MMNLDQQMFQQVLSHRTRRVESACESAAASIRTARTMQDVIRATQVTIPPELRAVRNTFGGYRRMRAAAESRLETLLGFQLKAIESARLAEAKTLLTQYLQRDWQVLRGDYASLYRRGEELGRKLLHRKEQAHSKVPNPFD